MTVPLIGLSVIIPPRAYAEGPIKPGAQLQNAPDLVGLVKAVKPAVVSITARIRVGADDQGNFDDNGQSPQSAMPFPFPFPFQFAPPTGQRMVEARGSGFIISQDGYVVTNNHVVKNATKVTVTLDDGSSFPAKIIGRDSKSDVALLKIKTTDKLPFIDWVIPTICSRVPSLWPSAILTGWAALSHQGLCPRWVVTSVPDLMMTLSRLMRRSITAIQAGRFLTKTGT